MADYFCDHGAYGLASNRLGLDAPTWGVPQEGDGTNKDAATASGVVSVNLTSITSNAGTVSIFGSAAISVGASATGATLAAQLVSAINGSSLATSHAALPGSPQVRNLVWARNTGATLEIMCRIGSSALNVLGVVWGGTWTSSAPSNLTFSGGSGGCWGWFINPAALGVSSSITVLNYGAWLHTPYAGSLPTINDTIWVRTGGGANKVVEWASAAGSSTQIIRHGAFSTNHVFDTNTKWTTDSTTGALVFYVNHTGWISVVSIDLAYAFTSLSALALGGFEIKLFSNNGAGIRVFESLTGTYGVHFKNVIFRDTGNASSGPLGIFTSNGFAGISRLNVFAENCLFLVTTPAPAVRSFRIPCGLYNASFSLVAVGCTFDHNISVLSDPGALINTALSTSESDVVLQGCCFKGFATGYTLFPAPGSWLTTDARLNIVVDNCSGLKMSASYVGLPTSTTFLRQSVHQIVFSNAGLASQAGLRIEDNRGVAEWAPDDPTPFPYLAATLPGSGTNYSIRLIWVRAVGTNRSRSFTSPCFRMFTQLAAATRTLTLQLLMHSSITTGVKASFAYIDSDGISRREESETIVSSAVTWTNAGSYSGFVSRKFEVTTGYAVKANSEIVATVQFYAAPPGSDATMAVYVDPEFTVA